MQTVRRFSLEQHEGDYQKWPWRTRLFVDGRPSPTKLAGYTLVVQVEVDGRYLLVLDYDCSFEEAYEVYLLDAEYRVLSRRSVPSLGLMLLGVFVGAPSISARNLWWRHEVIDARTIRVMGDRPPHLLVGVRDARPFGIGSLLTVAYEERPG